MKKLIILTDSLMRGGAERVTVELAEYFTRGGIPCDIISMRRGENEYPAPQGVERICVPGGNLAKKISGLRQAVKDSGGDMLLVMGTPLCMYAIPACAGLKIRVVVSERNDPNHFHGKNSTRVVSRWLMRRADGFVFQTADAKAYYDKSLKGRGTVIFNPLRSERLPQPYTGQRRKQIVTMGRLSEQKNQKILVQAFAALAEDYPEYGLTIYGDGALGGALRAQAEALGVGQRVSLPGNQPDVLEKIKDAALFVMSSDFEGMPNALIEAMAIGMPCVSTDCPCGGPRELVENRKSGLLVPVDDPAALEKAMRKLLEAPDAAREMGEKAVSIREKLHVDRIGRQWKDYFELTEK